MSATVPEPAAPRPTTDTYDVYRGLCAAIGVAPDPDARQRAREARDAFVDQRVAAMRDTIDRALASSPDGGRDAWLTCIAEAVSRFRFAFAVPLASHEVPDGGAPPLDRTSVRRAVERLRQSRWEEGYAVVEAWSRWPILTAPCRARLLTICGQIELWRLSRPERALSLLEEAHALSPDDAWIVSAVGDYWRNQGDTARAREYFARSRTLSPEDCNGYVSEGEGHEWAGAFDDAEQWYRRAIAEAPGESLGYDRLMRVLARPDTLAAHESAVRTLRDLRNMIDPDGAYDAALTLADYYVAAKRYDDAMRCLNLAIEEHPDWPRAFARQADVAREQGRLDDAITWCQRAIDLGPDSQDAYIVLARLYEERRDFKAALATYQRVPDEPRLLAGEAKASVGRMLIALGRLAEAEQVLLEDIRQWPTDEMAVAQIADLVDQYDKNNDLLAAERVLKAVLGARGEGYRITYHNLLGNIYFVRDENARAVAEYRAAIAASAPDAVLYRNLAGALSDNGEHSEANAALDTAFSIDHDEPKHFVRKAKVANARGRAHYEGGEYEEAVRAFTLATELNADEPIYLQNLARALDLVDRPGERVDAWRRALACYERSLAIPGAAPQENAIARLRAQIDVAQQLGERAGTRVHGVTPIVMDVGDDLVPFVDGGAGRLSHAMSAEVEQLRADVSARWGVPLPGIRIRGNSNLAALQCVVSLYEVPVSLHTVDGEASSSLTAALREILASVIIRHLAEFMGHQEWLAVLGDASVAEAASSLPLGSHEALTTLVAVGRALLVERVPLVPLAPVLRTVAQGLREGRGARVIAEEVRNHAEVRERLPGNHAKRGLVVASSSFEAVIRRSLFRRDTVAVLAMDPQSCQDALRAIREGIDVPHAVLVVEDPELRPFVARLMETEFPDVPVIARRELVGDVDAGTVLPDVSGTDALTIETLGNLRVVSLGPPPARPTTIGLEVQVRPQLLEVPSSADPETLKQRLAALQDTMFFELGILVPDAQISDDPRLEPEAFKVRVSGRETSGHAPPVGWCMVDGGQNQLARAGVEGRSIVHPGDGVARGLVPIEALAKLAEPNPAWWGPRAYVALEVEHRVREAAADFFTEPVARLAWDQLAQVAPDLVRIALERLGTELLSDVVRVLLRDGIPVRDLRGVLEAVLSINGVLYEDLSSRIVFTAQADSYCVARGVIDAQRLGSVDLAEHARTWLRAIITHTRSGGAATIAVYLLEPAMEQWISTTRSPRTDTRYQDFLAAVRGEVGVRHLGGPRPIILTTLEVRPLVQELVREVFPDLAVLSYQELSPQVNIQPIARLAWS